MTICKNKTVSYPALLEDTLEGGFVVTFRDVPEAITDGRSFEEALDYGADALAAATEFYLEDGRDFPLPSEPLDGEVLIELPAEAAARVFKAAQGFQDD